MGGRAGEKSFGQERPGEPSRTANVLVEALTDRSGAVADGSPMSEDGWHPPPFLDDPIGERQHPAAWLRMSTCSRRRKKGPHVTMDDEAVIAGRREAMTGGTPPGRSRGRLADEVYDALLGQMMSLRIEPGSRVTIDVLARELGVSQTPIRDALNRMESEGLVVRVPHAGYRIPPQITRHRFEDMLELRLDRKSTRLN